jgi:hypothetical protein
MTSTSGTPSGCIVSVGSLAGGVAVAPPPANSLQASGLLIKGDALDWLVPESFSVFCKTWISARPPFLYSPEWKPTSQTFSSVTDN